jgi:hypothetical protein
MIRLEEGAFHYEFPNGWEAMKWDATDFHQKRFQSFGGSSKAAEFAAYSTASTDKELWLIECKDFRPNGRSKTIELADEIAQKFKATLAGLVCARNDEEEGMRRFARMALKKTAIRCAVHWEHPISRPHRLWPAGTTRPNEQLKLRQRLAVADAEAILGNKDQINSVMAWKVSQTP